MNSSIIGGVVAALVIFWTQHAHSLTLQAPDEFESPYISQWRALENNILNTNDTVIIIHWHGVGGREDIMSHFISTIQTAQRQGKYIELYLNGQSTSAHAAVACYVNKLVWAPYASLLYHGFFMRMPISGNKVYNSSLTRSWLSPCVSRGILTNQDLTAVADQHKKIRIDAQRNKQTSEDYR